MTLHVALRSLAGGAMIGAAAALLLALNGRIAGVSGIVGRATVTTGDERSWRLAFVLGLLAGAVVWYAVAPGAFGTLAHAAQPASLARLAVAGLLVGVGTQLANGCTSGHGVCGLGRGSLRSLASVLTFMGVAIAVVFASRALGGGAL